VRPPARRDRRGFTLAEVAVTLAVVGLALVWMLQALNSAKVTAAQTRNLKLARELALLTLGQLESGQYREEIDDEEIQGTYAEVGYPDFSFEAVIGEANLPPPPNDQAYDNWLEERRRAQDKADEEEQEVEQAYERVQVRVTFPQMLELPNELVIERWLPWSLVHPSEEEETQAQGAAAANGGSAP
jgi:prepilin-type N-terminal cleavage/methylation domain-containing protein